MATVEKVDRIAEFAQELQEQFLSGHAREHAYRPALKRLMGDFNDVTAINDPKRSQHGNPDFVVVKKTNNDVILGHAEAKDITIDLNKILKTEQLRRYAGYEKLFLTNGLDFRFFQNGEEYQQVVIGRLIDGKIEFTANAFGQLNDELQAFLDLPPEPIKNGKRLAIIMGGKARRIRENVQDYLTHEDNEYYQDLDKIYGVMKKLLVHDLSVERFADMYAQTLVYGLFVARYNDTSAGDFSRSEARDLVPASNPFLREFFDHIAGPRFVKRLGHIVDELCEAFSVSDVHMLVQKHLKLFDFADDKDPIIHFYEDFLKEYDPVERKKMGAYYTPVPVVRFMIRQVDEILKRDFGLPQGLADTSKKRVTITRQGVKTKVDMHKVQILDPAVGTATFLNEIIKYIHQGFKGQEGRWRAYAEQDLLPRLYGFELMMAPYTIAHLKIGMTLSGTGVDDFKQRLGVYLTNTLEEGDKEQADLFSYLGLAEVISKEAESANQIKHEKPIMVIIGNPPYSGESSNKTMYANALVNKYKFEPGGQIKLQERNPKWINDDYVKFIAFAEDMIAKNGEGVVAMITNHGYLDNPTFRGMRWQLAQTFDKIYVLDLHGNSKKKEVAPDGTKDENVFDIQQGVAIIIAVKSGVKRRNQLADVYHADLYGKRQGKYAGLEKVTIWRKLSLDTRMLYFVHRDIKGWAEYSNGVALNALFNVSSVGVVTGADDILIGLTPKAVTESVERAKDRGGEGKIYERLQKAELSNRNVQPIAYRPFDNRYIYYSQDVVERSRANVVQHFLAGHNLGLSVHKREELAGEWSHIMILDRMSEHGLTSSKSTNFQFPLYLYHDNDPPITNFDSLMLMSLTAKLKKPFAPGHILDYIYAVLHSPTYRRKYKEFLKTDFPRVPIPKNDTEFKRLVGLGSQLRELHLMASPELDKLITKYPVNGDNEVEKVVYEDGKVYINQTQYFGGVPQEAWNFYVGGYQPAKKYLKDRKGRQLTDDELRHYQKIIKVLVSTHKLMNEIG